MNRRIALAVLATLFSTACDRADTPLSPSSQSAVGVVTPGPTHYSGRATTIDATVLGVNTKICDTGPLPSGGGYIHDDVAHWTMPGVLIVNILSCTTKGSNNVALSEASVFELILTVGGNSIFADVLSSYAAAGCGPPKVSGHSFIKRLNVNGQATRIGTAPNQTIPLPNGYIVINQQSSQVTPFSASITVTALRVVINKPIPIADVIISRSHADIDCP
jgi:hypothetical protein